MRHWPLLAALVAVVLAAVACTSSTAGPGTSTPVNTPTSSSAPPTSSSAVTSASTPPSSSASSSPRPTRTRTHHPRPTHSTTPTSSTPAPPSTTPPPSGPQPCTADQLSVSAVRGGAFQGQEIAGLLWTNTSSTTCTMRGYAFAQLHYKGNALGKPAKDDPGAVRTIVLHPGKSAQAQLTAVTTCQAPISDHVVEVAPDTHDARSVVMQLRGCSLSIDPVEAG